MHRIYIETNAINRARECRLSGYDFAQLLAKIGQHPVVGVHVIYELARGFLKPEHTAAAKDNFAIIRDLAPAYSLTVKMLFDAELNRLISGKAVVPLLDGLYLQRAQDEVARLASGIASPDAQQFVAGREAGFIADHKRSCARFIEQAKSLRSSMPESFAHLKSFEAVKAQFASEFPQMLETLLEHKITPVQAEHLTSSLDRYPGIRSGLLANIHHIFICIFHGVAPSRGVVDDNRHIIEASYCEAFLSNDGALLRRGNQINPELKFLAWGDICNGRGE